MSRSPRRTPAVGTSRASLAVIAVVGALVVPAAAVGKTAAVRYSGKETPKEGKGEAHPVSFTLTGTTVTKLTIGPGVAQCRPNGRPNDNPDAPFTTASPKLVLPKLTLDHGVFRESVGLSIHVRLMRASLTAPWKTSTYNGAAAPDQLTLSFDVASNTKKLGSFTSVTYNLGGLSVSWPANASGAFDAAGADVCEVIGSVTVTKQK